MENQEQNKWTQRAVILSLTLLFFNIAHTLEDFAIGAPEEAGIPAPVLATVISIILFLQALGIFWLGQKKKKRLLIHVFPGLFWPIALGIAQLPIIFNSENYRSGMISKVYVFAMIAVVLLMLFASIKSLTIRQKDA